MRKLIFQIFNAYLGIVTGECLKITANVKNTISGPITHSSKTFQTVEPLMRHLHLANKTLAENKKFVADLLIESDYWVQLVTGVPVALKENLFALETKLGCIINESMSSGERRVFPQMTLLTISEPFYASRVPYQELMLQDASRYGCVG